MKGSSTFFSIILLLWISASTFWYVCKIKKDCNTRQVTNISEEKNIPNKIEKGNSDTIKIKKKSIPSNKKSKKNFLQEEYTIYYFKKNSVTKNNISDDFVDFTKQLNNYLLKNPSSKVIITGYTDSSGSKQANFLFGKKRATFIKNKLIENGISKEYLIVKSMGELNPVSSNKTKEGRLKNRRVIIKIIKNI